MNEPEAAIRALVREVRHVIAGAIDETQGRGEVLAGIDAALDQQSFVTPEAREFDACRHLDACLGEMRTNGHADLADAIARARPHLSWTVYDAYPEAEIGRRFARCHAFAEVVGPGAAIEATDFDVGLFLIGPHVLYRDRHHLAPELYLPLTGPTRWRFGAGMPWETKGAGEPIWNPPNRVHATIVDAVPLLCLYAWTRDVMVPALVDPAPDWAAIDAALARDEASV